MEEIEYLCDRVNVIIDGSMVAEGSVADLIREHANGDRIVIEDAAEHEALREAIAAIGDDVSVTRTGGRLTVDTDDAHREAVAKLVSEHGATSRTVTASMDDVYVALTKQRASDGE